MKPGETTAALKRVLFNIFDTDGFICSGEAGEAAVFAPAAAELQISRDEVAYANATLANFAHLGDGLYRYEFANGEIAGVTEGEIVLRVKKIGTIRTVTVITPLRFDNVDTFTAGAITAAAIATDAIDADAIKGDAVTEIQAGLATAANLAVVAGYVDTEIGTIITALTAMQVDITRLLGAHRINSVTDGGAGAASIVYDSGKRLTSARVRVFASAAAANAAVLGAANGADGEIARYTLTATIAASVTESFKMVTAL